jgi:hypothetical protein
MTRHLDNGRVLRARCLVLEISLTGGGCTRRDCTNGHEPSAVTPNPIPEFRLFAEAVRNYVVDRLECLVFPGYDPNFDGHERPGLLSCFRDRRPVAGKIGISRFGRFGNTRAATYEPMCGKRVLHVVLSRRGHHGVAAIW